MKIKISVIRQDMLAVYAWLQNIEKRPHLLSDHMYTSRKWYHGPYQNAEWNVRIDNDKTIQSKRMLHVQREGKCVDCPHVKNRICLYWYFQPNRNGGRIDKNYQCFKYSTLFYNCSIWEIYRTVSLAMVARLKLVSKDLVRARQYCV